jgi:hypothetical protein
MSFRPQDYDLAAETIRQYRSGNRRFKDWIAPYLVAPESLLSDANRALNLAFFEPYIASVTPGEKRPEEIAGENATARSLLLDEFSPPLDSSDIDGECYLVKPRLILLMHPAIQLAQKLLLRDLLEFVSPKLGGWKEVLGQGDKTLTSDQYLSDVRKVCNRIAQSRRKSNATWFIKSDIKNFFPSIDRELLAEILLELSIPLKQVKQVEFFLSIPIQCANTNLKRAWAGKVSQYGQGVPLGLVISPLIANLFLMRSAEALRGTNYYRFVDDCLFWGENREGAQILKQEFEALLPMGLELHVSTADIPAKAGIFGPQEPFEFLGLLVKPNGHLSIPQKKFDRLRYRMSAAALQPRNKKEGAMDKLRRLQNVIDGCAGYYGPVLKTSIQQRNRLDKLHRDLVNIILEESGISIKSSSLRQRNLQLGIRNIEQTIAFFDSRRQVDLISYSDLEIESFFREFLESETFSQ